MTFIRNAIAPTLIFRGCPSSTPSLLLDEFLVLRRRVRRRKRAAAVGSIPTAPPPIRLRRRLPPPPQRLGGLNLCWFFQYDAGVRWLIKADKYERIRFCCLQSGFGNYYMTECGLKTKDVTRRYLSVEHPGLYHQGSSAILRVLSYFPPPYSLLSAFMIIPTVLRDALYDCVVKEGHEWLEKDNDCIVLQETELLERFLDGTNY